MIVKWVSRIRIEFLLALGIGLIAVAINAMYYHDSVTLSRAAQWMMRYFTFGNPYFLWFFAFIYLVFIWQFYLAIARIAHDYWFLGQKPTDAHAKELLFYLLQPLYLLAPLAIVTGPLFTLLGNMSYQLRFTQMDELLAAADFFIWGQYPFLWLPHIIQQDWMIELLRSAYMSLALFLSITFGLLFIQKNKALFRQGILAFLLSMVIAYPFFYAFPCQDPGNYFLRNIRNNPLSSQIQPHIETYQPPSRASQIITSIQNAETSKERDNQVPVSCFPSMHAVWAYFVIYFMAVLNVWTLLFTVPWTVVVLTGGLYFAQHYFIDYVIAIPLALLSIIMASWLLHIESLWKKDVL